ncbi:Sodium- and chloride-dependent betaine transporter [Caenorhabditis elegans]|uniref:Sodium- and chloride-dependent betaine transporter n=1 Tax=Caenorhabditis elegans TaxID=6239 RepID=SNF3_CAEEL|nr:Sodium- and chloride-dependent betaine transporter [Caenorhabditis elegans]G5EBN9.1 RecName: Full=Sodium- and chloride-dependent betaine transporter; AltName: Full=Betaine transporter SNF-3; AltName: Full=Na(+)/Cl(-) betaine/GABA transporter; AltName: Full=Sodium:neurotransmitter symporter family protein 3 [Caenorhabditis elegans]AAZ23105.1 sodium-coupled betaine transporter protein [Caenorhabditis elegans]ABF20556.1 SNF-3 [Caenorhabditis elegans]CCD63487.1 Sodium- and chloride-dependent bet|eukprot:NP_493910.2 Sodium-and chloride-dependent betaine transporter [Caenorhabditis elegans]
MGTSEHVPLPTDEAKAKELEQSQHSEEPDRGQWTGKFDFLMSMVAYAVGLGNVWRFPYLCYKNGGGSFLVVYMIFFCLAAVPIFLMEVTVGQYLQKGAMEMWLMCPLFRGVGIGNVVIAFMCIAYFCVIVAWAMFYMISSIAWVFPWETCNNYWNDATCVTGKENFTELARIKALVASAGGHTQTSVEQFWEKRVLHDTGDISEFGGIQWELFFIMAAAWLIVYFALWKGITQARKFVYFCALFPYVLIFILLIRGLTLEGAGTGIYFYLKPNATRLLDTAVWKDAGTQVFYSYGVGFGALIALGSHNKFNHNCFKDAITMCFINGCTSITAGFAVFSILGYMSHVAQKDISEIVKPGVGLAFLAYPEVASNLPMKQVFAVLFFLMITILGLDSQVCMMEGLFTALEDAFPILRKYKKQSLGIFCLFFFCIGIPMVTHSGSHWLTLFDAYGASGYALLFVVFFEVVGLAYGFGAHNIRKALHEMIGVTLPKGIEYVWKFCAPATSLVLFVFCVVYYHPVKYPDGKDFPFWANAFGWFLSSCSMVVIPGYAIYYLFFTNKHLTLKERVRKGLNLDGSFESPAKKNLVNNAEELKFIESSSQ